MKTYEEIKTKLDLLVEEYVLLKRDTSLDIDAQLSTDIDNFLYEKIGEAYDDEGEYVWYTLISRYSHIFNEKGKYKDTTNKLNRCIKNLKEKYK